MTEMLFAEIGDETTADDSYRPLSGLAVGGFILGCLSVVAIFSSLLWGIAILAVVLNLAALRHVALRARKGHGLARAGLALSVLFFTAALSYSWCQEELIRRQAQRIADLWLEAMLSGNLPLAHQLTLPPAGRESEPDRETLAEIYRSRPTLAADLQTYAERPRIKKLAELAQANASARPRFAQHVQDLYREEVMFEYELRYEEDGKENVYSLPLSVQRQREHASHIKGWHVSIAEPGGAPQIDLPPPPPPDLQ